MGYSFDWFYRGRVRGTTRVPLRIIIFIIVLLMVLVSGGLTGYYYYTKYKKAAELAKAKQQAAMQLQQKKDSIHSFYEAALKGADVAVFMQLYDEILRSRQPIVMAGFSEDNFSCSTDSCQFSYLANDNAVFSVQQKWFRQQSYSPSFSQNSMDFTAIPSALDHNALLEAFNQHQPISLVGCTDLLNYIYGYNSMVAAERRFTLTELPASSVIGTEDALVGNAENYGLLAGKWQLSLPDNYVSVASFWQQRPYSSSFIFQSVAGKKGTLDINGTFLCKK